MARSLKVVISIIIVKTEIILRETDLMSLECMVSFVVRNTGIYYYREETVVSLIQANSRVMTMYKVIGVLATFDDYGNLRFTESGCTDKYILFLKSGDITFMLYEKPLFPIQVATRMQNVSTFILMLYLRNFISYYVFFSWNTLKKSYMMLFVTFFFQNQICRRYCYVDCCNMWYTYNTFPI